MWEFLLQADSTTTDGATLQVSDASDWSLAADTRDKFGIFVVAEYRLSATPTEVAVATYDPLTDDSWLITTDANGRYTVTGYAFYERNYVAPSPGDVQIHTDGELYEWDGADWTLVQLEDVLDKAFYTSTPLEVAFLAYAYAHKNDMVLEYVAQVKNDINNGAEQNKLYYKRSDLDYFDSLIHSAEYNWSLDLYQNYYDVVTNLNTIINTKEIS